MRSFSHEQIAKYLEEVLQGKRDALIAHTEESHVILNETCYGDDVDFFKKVATAFLKDRSQKSKFKTVVNNMGLIVGEFRLASTINNKTKDYSVVLIIY